MKLSTWGTLLKFKLICDIMMNLEGSIRPAVYLANGLVARGHEVQMISPIMSSLVERSLQANGVEPLNLHTRHITNDSDLSLLWFETWAHKVFLRLNLKRVGKNTVIINFSHIISAPSLVWYTQGPPSIALKDMEKELSISFRIIYNILKPIIEYADKKFIKRMGKSSAFVIGNSKFCASMYSKFGVKIHDVIYPPIDCQTFRPSTLNISSDYALTYFGKETKFSVIKKMADKGVKIKAFGSKTSFIQKDLLEHPNIEFLGRVSMSKLVEAYSNALFTLFPFTHEPFGYVPLESMACGTPVLTYNIQGPSECVIDGCTGWLADTDKHLMYKALEIWKGGYPSRMRPNCREVASKFDKNLYIEKWQKLLS